MPAAVPIYSPLTTGAGGVRALDSFTYTQDGAALMNIAFVLTTLVVVATPGTGALYTITAGLSRGTRASLVAAAGCTLGIVPHMVAAITGLAAVLNSSAAAFLTLKYLGVAYLLVLAWQTWRDKTPLTVEQYAGSRSNWRVVRTAVLINMLNPKLTIFFFAFLPQFVQPGSEYALIRMLALSAIFMLVTLIVFALYGTFAAAARRHVISRPQVVQCMRRIFGGTYVALGGRLALSTR